MGDIIADVYQGCAFKKMCPDAPTVRAIVEGGYELLPGGAANVAINLAALSPDTIVDLIGIVDVETAWVIKHISRNRVTMANAVFTDHREMLVKKRIVLDGDVILRLDSSDINPGIHNGSVAWALEQYFYGNRPDLIVLSDYAGGTMQPWTVGQLLAYRERLLIDTKDIDLSKFEGSLCAKLNYHEWEAVVRAGEAAPERFFRSMVVTQGKYGALLLKREELSPTASRTHQMMVRGHEVETVDVCGCGDTFLAGLTASLLKNDDMYTAVQFANAAASTVVTQPRTAVADLKRTLGLVGREHEVSTGCPDWHHRDPA